MVARATFAVAATSRICTASYPPSAPSSKAASTTRWRRSRCSSVSSSVSVASVVEPSSEVTDISGILRSLLATPGQLAERHVLVDAGAGRQAEHPLADDVALGLVAAAGHADRRRA